MAFASGPVLPPAQPIPWSAGIVDFSGYAFGVRTEETTQRFPLGTFKDYPDGRRFRYCYVGTGGLQAEFGCCFPYKTIAYAVAAVQASGAGTAGSYKVSVTIGASEEPQSGVFSINDPFLVGGYIVVGNGGNQHPQNRMIVGNTAVTTAGGVCTLTLDEPLESVCTAASTGLEIMFNRYAYVTSMNVTNSGYVTPIGMPAVTCDAGAFAWVQTRGPCWITSDSNTCNSDGDRRIYFANNGSCVSGNDITGDVGVQVFAGNAIDASSDGASNAPFVYLQLE